MHTANKHTMYLAFAGIAAVTKNIKVIQKDDDTIYHFVPFEYGGKSQRKLIQKIKTFMLVHDSFNHPNHFLFFNTTRPIGVQTIRRRFDYYTKKAGLPRITIHGIRHSNCTWLLSKALNPQEIGQVSKRLGHSSTKITLDIYMGIHKQEDPLIQDTLNEIV
mgnify:CR=1 FL=1